MAHAKLSPSKATRWLHCPGSVALTADMEEKSSVYAQEGTKAHAWAAYMLDRTAEPSQWPIDEEMQSFVQVYVSAVKRAAEGKQLYVEVPVNISKFTGEAGAKGTADAVIIGVDGTLEVHDLKYGMGHMVYAENNEQLMMYALGVLDAIEPIVDVQNIKLVIHQPRRDHYSEWIVSYAGLMTFGEKVQEVSKIALSCQPGEHLTPFAEACLWCPAKATCPALRDAVHNTVMVDFDVMPTPEGEYPTSGEIALVETWLGAVKQAIFEKLQRFEPVPGWKLVLGRPGNRAWKDAAAAEELLKALRVTKGDSHEQSLKSPAQLEKAGLSPRKWDAIKEQITRADAKPTMVDANDPRPAVEPAKADEFEMFK